ncbi:hypothetical protein DICVIV_09319 [Dictyocaulus viviparus]|uniref:Uncharacterized protein n=1 Tax=Dictyocaulus viviparus TaxID=29172 RepID=A0A0D8XLQ5_DICVI|nr:hypothetical protein DICVIV_09319 [Dictyocaulus viviparus]
MYLLSDVSWKIYNRDLRVVELILDINKCGQLPIHVRESQHRLQRFFCVVHRDRTANIKVRSFPLPCS